MGVSILPSYTVQESDLRTRVIESLEFEHPIWIARRKSSQDVIQECVEAVEDSVE